MKYYVIDRKGKIRSGNADTWNEVKAKLHDGETLYNPHTKKRVIGWNKYKAEMYVAEKANNSLTPSAEPPKFPDKFPFWARLKISKHRTTLVIDEEAVKRNDSDKTDDYFVHREAIHKSEQNEKRILSGDYEEIFPNPDREDKDSMYLKRPRKRLKRDFEPHNKNLDMPEELRERYDKNNYKDKDKK